MESKKSTQYNPRTELYFFPDEVTLSYTNLYRFVITCGSEGDIRIWKGIDDDDPTDKCVGEKAFAVAQKVPNLHSNLSCFSYVFL